MEAVDSADLWRIPLFAVVFTLLIARPGVSALPTGRAQLLAAAVRDTVERWELARLSETTPGPGVRAKQLLDGYGEIAHVLIGEPAGCPAETVSRRVEAMLTERWRLAPGEASAQATFGLAGPPLANRRPSGERRAKSNQRATSVQVKAV